MYSWRQFIHRRLTSRCPITAFTVEAIKNGSIPISSRRGKHVAALFVCRVENTKCPVSAAWTPRFAVSPSRISPTIMIFGSWRSSALSPEAKVIPALALVWVWLTPGILYSTGSSIVEILTSGVLSSDRTLNKLVDFPDPVGPVTRIIPFGWAIASFTVASDRPQYPSWSSLTAWFDSSKIRMTTFSPSAIGNVETRSAYCFPETFILNRPSCGTRRSSIFRLERILMRLTKAPWTFRGNLLTSFKTPSIR